MTHPEDLGSVSSVFAQIYLRHSRVNIYVHIYVSSSPTSAFLCDFQNHPEKKHDAIIKKGTHQQVTASRPVCQNHVWISFLFFCFCCFLFLKWGNKTNITENDMLTEKVLVCLSTSKQSKLPLQQLRTYSNFPHPPQLWHFCLWGKSSSALCSSPLLSVCVTSPKYSLSYWRPVQPVLCPSDVFTTLCPTPPHLSFCQGNFCLLRHSSLLLPHPNPTPTPSALTYTS